MSVDKPLQNKRAPVLDPAWEYLGADGTILPVFAHYPPNDGSEAFRLLLMARVAASYEDEDTSAEFSEASYKEARKADLPLIESAALSINAISTATIGLRSEAIKQAQQALDIAHALQDDALKARAFCAIAFVALETLDEQQALDMLERALPCARRAQSDYDHFWSLNNLAHIHGDRAVRHDKKGDIDARDTELDLHRCYAQEALVVAQRTTIWRQICFALLNLSEGEFLRGNFDQAQVLVDAYSRLAKLNNSARLTAYANLDTARLLAAKGQLSDAIILISCSDHLETLCQTDDLKLRTRKALAQYNKQRRNFEEAITHLEIAHDIGQKIQMTLADRHIRALTAKLQVEEAVAEAKRHQLEAQKLEQRNALLEENRKELEKSAMHDALTGLGNRRAAETAIFDAIERRLRFSLAYADIDYFKSVNDRFGHQKGDDVLVAFGGLIENNLRGSDLVFRIGGEEFLLLIVATEDASSVAICERVREAITEYPWHTIDPDLNITSSFGLSQWRNGEDYQATIARADAALYEAKRAGRNRVICDPTS